MAYCFVNVYIRKLWNYRKKHASVVECYRNLRAHWIALNKFFQSNNQYSLYDTHLNRKWPFTSHSEWGTNTAHLDSSHHVFVFKLIYYVLFLLLNLVLKSNCVCLVSSFVFFFLFFFHFSLSYSYISPKYVDLNYCKKLEHLHYHFIWYEVHIIRTATEPINYSKLSMTNKKTNGFIRISISKRFVICSSRFIAAWADNTFTHRRQNIITWHLSTERCDGIV